MFISADMLLEAVHRSYDATLLMLERSLLRGELETLLSRTRQELAAGGVALAPSIAADADLYLTILGEVAGRLAEMAEFQRTGQPHTPEQLDFINQAIQVERNCDGTDILTGWYWRLFVAGDALDFDPTIADVHTDPGEVIPPREPSVLHVATGNPRLLVMTRETSAGPRAYAGIVMSYFEHLAEGNSRLDDEAWQAQLQAGSPPADVPWLADALPTGTP